MIPFFIPHVGCPYICVFCNQSRITKNQSTVSDTGIQTLQTLLEPSYMERTIKEYIGPHREDKYWEVAFYGGSFSAISKTLQEQLLTPVVKAYEAGLIDGIRCSTRPDALDEEAIDFLYDHYVRTIEIGVQSMDDKILENSKRGHTSQDVIDAVHRLRKKGIKVGLQILPGLPGETWQTMVNTAESISKLKPDFVRIYPVLVIEDTELADMYRKGLYEPLTVEQAIQYSAFLKTWFDFHHIEVIRIGLQSTEELDSGEGLVAGPYEPAMGELVVNEQYRQRIERVLLDHDHEFSTLVKPNYGERNQTITVYYPRQLTSKIRGHQNRNVEYFEKTYSFIQWQWKCDEKIATDLCAHTIYMVIDDMKYMI